MKKAGDLWLVWKTVFSRSNYSIIAVLIAIAFYISNIIITNTGNIFYNYRHQGLVPTIKLTGLFLVGFTKTILLSSVITLVLISLLTGILISLLVFNFQTLKARSSDTVGFFTGIGIFLGFFAPGCVACGIGLAGILGLGTSLAFLPFNGLELSFLAISVLFFSIIKISLALAEPCSYDATSRFSSSHILKGGNNKK